MKHGKRNRWLALVLSWVMVLTLWGTVFAADTADVGSGSVAGTGGVSGADTCSVTVSDSAPGTAVITTGEMYQLDLSTVFTDSEGHTLGYELSGGDFGEQTKITEGVLYFSVGTAGTYTPTITATCENGVTAVYEVAITVNAAEEGSEEQYGYDETAASSVTVYVTINNDGIPIRGNDDENTVLAHLKVEVPYFDLNLYGLSDYYRYATESGQGGYTSDQVVERPTALHLYIYLLERYYLGLPRENCGKGTSGLMDYATETDVYDMNGELAYIGTNKALNLTGSSTSMYMQQFWGHDENLMYYRNHVYPLMSAGWGSTADYILLSDNDTMDVAMFTDWSFWNDGGAFTCFDEDAYTGQSGDSLTVTTLKYETKSMADGGSESFLTISDLNVGLYDSNWKKVMSLNGENGSYTFTLPTEPGEYYLLGLDPNCGSEEARLAAATARVSVENSEALTGDVNGDGEVTNLDAALIYAAFNGLYELTEEQTTAADVNKDGQVTNLDAAFIYAYFNGRIGSFDEIEN